MAEQLLYYAGVARPTVWCGACATFATDIATSELECSAMSATDDRLRENNKRRVARMNTWIEVAEATPDESEKDHVRFVFYWIAYEAAWQGRGPDVADSRRREKFHGRLAQHDRGSLRRILQVQKQDAVRLLELRQASPSFWNRWREDAGVRSPEEWEIVFGERVGSDVGRLNEAIRTSIKKDVSETLNVLFRNLSIVRNQIVHGGSAGPESRGRTQVILGAGLLKALIPCFRDSIESNIDHDWGEPPFPRVGSAPDEKCPPPWLLIPEGRG
jgi:hypothetical protein